jgi:hypothetical protein
VTAKEPPTLASVFAGIGFVRRNPAILGTISLDLFAVLLGGVTALLPVYARDILHTGPWGLGILRAAPAIGALLMTAVLSRHPIERRVGMRMFQAVIIFGLATVVFAISHMYHCGFVRRSAGGGTRRPGNHRRSASMDETVSNATACGKAGMKRRRGSRLQLTR